MSTQLSHKSRGKTHIHRKQTFNLLIRELQRRLMLRPSRIGNNSMQRSRLFDDPIHGRRDTWFLGDVRLDGEKAVRVLLG